MAHFAKNCLRRLLWRLPSRYPASVSDSKLTSSRSFLL